MAAEGPPDIPDRSGPDADAVSGGLRGPFFRDVGKRKEQGRDVKIILTAKDAQTGVGKSNLSDFLAHVLDTSEEGFNEEKATIEPGKMMDLYNTLAPGSAMVMEEGGQFDARRANTHENVDATHKWQMARVREICAIINLPSPQDIDSRLERLADYWINVERRGFARIYKKKIHPIKRQTYYETCQTLEWPNMDKSKTFQWMGKMKDEYLDREESDDNWVRESDVQDRIEKAEKQARRETRDEILGTLYNETEVTADIIASASGVEISPGRVRQIGGEID